MRKILVGLLVLVTVCVFGLSYIGVFPVFSKYLSKPTDLGIKADPELVYAFESKYATNSANDEISLNVDLSSEEVTSIFKVWEIRDKYFPLRDVQIRFNPDGVGEASGYVYLPTVISLAKNLGYSDSDIEQGKKYVQLVSGDLPFYVKGTGGISNNNLTISPATFQLGRVTVPESITKAAAVAVTDMIEKRIKQIGGADIIDASFTKGKFHLNGSVPKTIKY